MSYCTCDPPDMGKHWKQREKYENKMNMRLSFCVMQRDTTGLTSENKELKLRLQAMEQQAHLRDGMHCFKTCVCHLQ